MRTRLDPRVRVFLFRFQGPCETEIQKPHSFADHTTLLALHKHSPCFAGTVFSESERKAAANARSPFDDPQSTVQAFHAHIYCFGCSRHMERNDVLGFIETLVGWGFDNVHLLATGQKESEIERRLELLNCR